MLCVDDTVAVPVHVYRHLAIVKDDHRVMESIGAFWRGRGLTIPTLMVSSMSLDVPELFRQVAIRGGFWACTAAQACTSLADVPFAFLFWVLCAQEDQCC